MNGTPRLVRVFLAVFLLAIGMPLTLSAQTQRETDKACRVYFASAWADSHGKVARLMSENQTKWWNKQGAKKYPKLCQSHGPVRYVVVSQPNAETITFDEPEFNFSGTTVSGDVNLQIETNGFHFEQRTGTRLIMTAAVYIHDSGPLPRLVYTVQRSGVMQPDKSAFEAALKWIAETEHLRK